MTVRPLVIYHADCVDGAMAAAVCSLKLGDGADYVPAKYQHEETDYVTLERATGATIYLVDFSFNAGALLALAEVAERVVVMDHRKSAREDLLLIAADGEGPAAKIEVYFDLDRCGASLAWARFFPEIPETPMTIRYAEDHDLQRYALSENREVHAYFDSLLGEGEVARFADLIMAQKAYGVFDPKAFDVGLYIRSAGEAILRTDARKVRALVDRAERVRFAGIEALAVNTPLFQNAVCDALAAKSPSGVGVAWEYIGDGRYKVSLRSAPYAGTLAVDIINVSTIAKHYGGASSASSAGSTSSASFDCNELPWLIEELRERLAAERPLLREGINLVILRISKEGALAPDSDACNDERKR